MHFRVDIGQVECYNELTLTVISHYGAKAVKKYVQREVEGLIVGSYNVSVDAQGLLALYEDYNDTSKYKIIVFYPGHRENNSFRLFGTLPDNHTYRATLLINE